MKRVVQYYKRIYRFLYFYEYYRNNESQEIPVGQADWYQCNFDTPKLRISSGLKAKEKNLFHVVLFLIASRR